MSGTIAVAPAAAPVIGVDMLTKCGICGLQLREPLRLHCSHVFCKQCLLAQNKAGKLECPTCKTVNTVQNGDIDKTFKPSPLAKFWVKVGANYFDQLTLTDAEQVETIGICPSCQLPPNPNAKPKKGADGQPIPEPEPLKVKLSLCFHCGQKLCEACRNKHYTAQRQEALKLTDTYQTASGNISVVCEKLNESRARKLTEYEKMKADITARKQEIMRNLDIEEKELFAKIEQDMAIERTKIKNTDLDSKRLISCREAVKGVRDKLTKEQNVKKLSTMCRDFLGTQDEWNGLLQGEAARNDPNKEKRIVFIPTKQKEELLGTIDQKKENLKIKQVDVPKGEKSSVCTIV